MSKLELVVMAGAETKQFLSSLTGQLDRVEKLIARAEKLGVTGETDGDASDEDEGDLAGDANNSRGTGKRASGTTGKDKPARASSASASFDDDDGDDVPSTAKADASADEEDDEDFAPKKSKGKKAAAAFDDEEDEAEVEVETKPAAKAAKPKKTKGPTLDDVNDAAREHAGRVNRASALRILKKNFKVASISDLEETDFAACIKLMQGKGAI